MAQATIGKRIRQCTRQMIRATSESKKKRYEQKRAFLLTLSSSVRFYKGPKIQFEGGYR